MNSDDDFLYEVIANEQELREMSDFYNEIYRAANTPSGAYNTEFITQEYPVVIHNRFNAKIARAKKFVKNTKVILNVKNR